MASAEDLLKSGITVRLDRVQLVSQARSGRRPPQIKGFRVVADSFVRPQTTIATYARRRTLKNIATGTVISWQYDRRAPWLLPWKINIVPDDSVGLTRTEMASVLARCRHYRFLVIEIAIDFGPSAEVNEKFVRKHGTFGKSRREKKGKGVPCTSLRHPKV